MSTQSNRYADLADEWFAEAIDRYHESGNDVAAQAAAAISQAATALAEYAAARGMPAADRT